MIIDGVKEPTKNRIGEAEQRGSFGKISAKQMRNAMFCFLLSLVATLVLL